MKIGIAADHGRYEMKQKIHILLNAKGHLEEETFRCMHNEDAMATEQLAEGIRKFNSYTHRLQQFALARVAETIG